MSVSVSENTWYGNTWCGNTWERTQRTHLVVVRHHGSVDRDNMSEWERVSGSTSSLRSESEYTGMTWVCGDTVCENSRVSECVVAQVMGE